MIDIVRRYILLLLLLLLTYLFFETGANELPLEKKRPPKQSNIPTIIYINSPQ